MLIFYGAAKHGPIPMAPGAASLPEGVDWIDAFQPTPEETAFLERCLDTRIPTLADLNEIETSSRLAVDGDTIVMSLPATVKDETGYPKGTPIGFVVSKDRVATLRFEHLPSFENLSKQVCGKGTLSPGGVGATVTILEIIIDHIADVLEHVGGDLDSMSRSIFSKGMMDAKGSGPQQSNQNLRHLLKTVGRGSDLVSKVSESLLGLSRICPFLATKGGPLVTPELKARLDTIGADTKSLHEFQDHLVNKTQFLLDTLLGLANIEQNNVFRVLTIVSVIGIPPTFFASMYGMNFKNMPEYDWAHGYAYGLTLIICSAVLPAVWFKIKGWW